ncbi:hypothetical protein HQ81_0197 [Dickeya phage phiDP23.1]|uniref:Homing endonuclease F-LimIII n=16 Tax=Aglimvirinae TaxID=2169530 RepID=I0J2P8_9CAUD|nr:homing endonuclease [Dickeya phage vB-DsoM-LIMEstone1]YP_009103030.1 homing endonuclease [Dickeya phage RC-2014]AIM51406.1 hypothetical protein HQ80_0026 [Dickeya phage phiD3]AIM51565.1 hypothetical protein HQ82_0077 [Dickeya phage phiDP10.3]AIM51924.1 hypothetical protein HQ81_0197 [Dickeya phage phiDP23.1]ASD51209.1 putative homing endonuclease F-LimIII [Dickeya phage JA15]ASD51407.1 putative homing endonuclease F-LimIII [Dickeya phage XF4]ATW62028.1 putative homing endonuclease [Dickey
MPRIVQEKECACCHTAFKPKQARSLYCNILCERFMSSPVIRSLDIDNLPKNSDECKEWVVKYFFTKQGNVNSKLLRHPLLLSYTGVDVMGYLSEHNSLTDFRSSVSAWLYDLNNTGCIVCGKETTIDFDAEGGPAYREFCSNKCMKESMKTGGVCRERMNETMMGKYGVSHALQNKEIMEKAKETSIERFGVEYAMQSEEIKQRTVKTNQTRYGVDFPMSHPPIVSKSRSMLRISCIEKYGVPTVMDDPSMWKYITSFQHNSSKPEKEITSFLESHGVKCITGDYSVLAGKRLQLDIYCPEHKLAIEFNGLYWHTEQQKPGKEYHLDKTRLCEARGIQLIHIWEDEWRDKPDIVKGMILAKLGVKGPLSYARKHRISSLKPLECNQFLEQHHIQGSVAFSSLRLGLEDKEGNAQAVMVFTKRTHGTELVRFASNGCHGAFSKLLSHAIKYCLDPTQTVYSFGDRCVVSRLKNVYLQNGFIEKEVLAPDYKYVDKQYSTRTHKFSYRKDKFKELGYEIEGKTEDMLAEEARLSRIWGCGLVRYEFQRK